MNRAIRETQSDGARLTLRTSIEPSSDSHSHARQTRIHGSGFRIFHDEQRSYVATFCPRRAGLDNTAPTPQSLLDVLPFPWHSLSFPCSHLLPPLLLAHRRAFCCYPDT